MNFEGTFEVKAPPQKVWDFLMKPENISKCLPDLQKLEVEGPDKFKATIKVGVGFIKGNFTFEFNVLDKKPPSHAKLLGHGSGTGSVVDMDTLMDLEATPEGGTKMAWKADAKVGGLVASVGQRLLEGTAQKIVKNLFECFRAQLEK